MQGTYLHIPLFKRVIIKINTKRKREDDEKNTDYSNVSNGSFDICG